MSTLYRGGRVYAAGSPSRTALLVRDGTVAWVGDGATAPDADEVVDLDGALVTPAFVDAHVHTTSTGLALTGLDLTGVPSLAAALDRVERYAREHRGGVVLGTGWDETRWPERRPPTAAELDRASYGGVVYLARTDVHSSVASSALLAVVPEARDLAGYGADGYVTLDAHHRVRRAALGSLRPTQRRAAQRATRRRAAELGIGCIHELAGPDISSAADLAELQELAETEPGPQVIGYWAQLGEIDVARVLGLPGGAGDLFLDGTLGSHTAALWAPYADADSSGRLNADAEQVAGHVVLCAAAGLQAGFHVIGDRAVDTVLDGFELAAARLGLARVRAGRHRLEHVEMAGPRAIERMARLGVGASVQPAFDATWGGPADMYAARLGAARAATMNPYAAFAAAGVPLALGSDSPVTPLDPWGGVRAAVGHRSAGSGLSVAAAFAAATRGGWRAAGVDDAGVLGAGAPAHLAVWSTGPSAATPDLPDLSGPTPRCLRTVVRGRTIADAGALS